MRRVLLRYPDSRLRQKAARVDRVDQETKEIWDEMIAVMDAMPGYGLAAPQLGISRALAVVDCSVERGKAVRLANPEIIETSAATITHREASPNLPGVNADVTRPREVLVRFLNSAGQWDRRWFRDLWAVSVQHQIDHLNGRLFVDRLSRTKRNMLLKKVLKHGD